MHVTTISKEFRGVKGCAARSPPRWVFGTKLLIPIPNTNFTIIRNGKGPPFDGASSCRRPTAWSRRRWTSAGSRAGSGTNGRSPSPTTPPSPSASSSNTIVFHEKGVKQSKIIFRRIFGRKISISFFHFYIWFQKKKNFNSTSAKLSTFHQEISNLIFKVDKILMCAFFQEA